MSGQRTEFRVRWRRHGQWRISTRIYQSWGPAYRKAQGIAALERVKHDTTYSEMPGLVEGPIIEVRTVGDWTPNEFQPLPPTEGLLERMRSRYSPSVQHDDMPF